MHGRTFNSARIFKARQAGEHVRQRAAALHTTASSIARLRAATWIFAAIASSAVCTCPQAMAEAPWMADGALLRNLQHRVTLTWRGQTIAGALATLGKSQQIAVWLDRRVDPETTVELTVVDQPLHAALDSLAQVGASDKWGWTALRGIVYFGSRQTARELATLSVLAHRELARAPVDARRRWLAATAWEIPRLSQPRDLLQDLVASTGTTLQNAADVPHDLWRAKSLPPLDVADRVVLLLAGFDLRGELSANGRTLRVAPINRPVQLTQQYMLDERTAQAIEALAAADPVVAVRRQGRRVRVAARWEDHERLRAALQVRQGGEADSAATSPASDGPQRFTLSVENQPLERILSQIAAQLNLTVEWDSASQGQREAFAAKLVSCAVTQADLDGLLHAILEPAGLTFARDGQTVTLREAD